MAHLLVVLDTILALTIVGLAWVLLKCQDLFRAIIFYIIFGLLMAVIWGRLNAVDVALVEAAVGAGLTGALFLLALQRIERRGSGERRVDAPEERSGLYGKSLKKHHVFEHGLIFTLVVMLFCLGSLALLQLTPEHHVLPTMVQKHLQASGAKNQVTAVLLNFRGYDTLLEICVLLLAAVGVWSVGPVCDRDMHALTSPIFKGFVRLVTPLMMLFAGFLLYNGANLPGGAFQAGSVLASVGILLFFYDHTLYYSIPDWLLRFTLILGAALFLTVALLPVFFKGFFLSYPQQYASGFILLIESAASLSIAVGLFVLFVQSRTRLKSFSSPEKAKMKGEL